MRHKKTGLLIILLVVVSLIPLSEADDTDVDPLIDEGYILDQMQTENGFFYPVSLNNPAAQKFTPAISPLAKVRLLIRYEGDFAPSPSQLIQVSIRKFLDGEDLTSVKIPATMVETEETWVNFDFDDITITPEEPYYIVLESLISQGEIYWFSMQNMDTDMYDRGEAYYLDSSGSIVSWEMFPGFTDFCFKSYSYAGKIPDLSCHAVFGWPDQQPGGTLSDDFSIRNIGDSHSLLNWEIVSFPEWGNWTFTPSSGFDLEPEDGELTISVTVEVPDDENQAFSGEIVVANSQDETDTAVIPVSLSTEKAKVFSWMDQLPWVIQWVLDVLFGL